MWLPSKAFIEDMGARLKDYGKCLSKTGLRDIAITIDMGGSCRRYSYRNGAEQEPRSYRHLFVDDIIVTTLDKFLFRVFGYGEQNKSYIFPHRIFGEAVAKKPFIIFDEAHEYDKLAFSNFRKLLEALFIKGQSLCVMSATLPGEFIDFLQVIDATKDELGKQQRAFQEPSMPHPEKHLTLAPVKKSMVATLTDETKKRYDPYDPSKRIIVRTETVKNLKALYDAFKHLNPLVYHGHMTTEQRNKVIQEIKKRQESKDHEGYLVLATSAIEAGCDFDAHPIITELCNPDSLAQLAGRLNRQGQMPDAELVVVVGEKLKPFDRDDSLSKEERQKYLETYLDTLHGMNDIFQPKMLSALFPPPEKDWMGEILFDMLWEYVYESDLTSEPLWKRGILVTRSWEPAVTVCTGLDDQDRPQNPIQVGIRKLVKKIYKKADELKKEPVENLQLSVSLRDKKWEWHADIKRRYYKSRGKGEAGGWELESLPEKFPLSCYEARLLCVIRPDYVTEYYDETFGYIDIPKLFIPGYKDGFKRYLDYQPHINTKGCFAFEGNHVKRSGRVWYLER